ncbi:hypothetical protein CNBI3240 [Cryptococcus deneoformans B-3501A]|uniref:hypothetical protein n=1 Tax=Cryptococcus deneoformans (strain B-3501A) TaxID=283643 RepID=UPI000042DABF|nr:hypothetical protein CNBI3240 [Cryptococcus neoformans var. neoformans B-3501A]EAL18738.1 hypothetical protein CNBI3240 [Cryptococcus neoformans var. neoformans B-3501A]
MLEILERFSTNTTSITTNSRAPETRHLAKEPDSFSGNPTELENFLTSCVLYMDCYPGTFNSDKAKINFIISHCRHKVMKSLRPLMNRAQQPELLQNYEEFLKYLRRHWGDPDEKWNAKREIRNRQERRYLSGYKDPGGLTNITLRFFKPNLPAHVQPMDAGIISAFKSRYRAKVIPFALANYEDGVPPHLCYKVDIKSAMEMADDSWNEITGETVENCWKKVSGCIRGRKRKSFGVSHHSLILIATTVIGLARPQFGPRIPEKEQPVWSAYHGTEIEGHCVFDRYHYVRVLHREWDSENYAKRLPLTGFNSPLRYILFCLWLRKSTMSI